MNNTTCVALKRVNCPRLADSVTRHANCGISLDSYAYSGYYILCDAVEEEYCVNVAMWNEPEDGQFSICISEAGHTPPPPNCMNALSVFGPYTPALTLCGSIVASSPTAASDEGMCVIAVLDSYDDGTDWINVDSSGICRSLAQRKPRL